MNCCVHSDTQTCWPSTSLVFQTSSTRSVRLERVTSPVKMWPMGSWQLTPTEVGVHQPVAHSVYHTVSGCALGWCLMFQTWSCRWPLMTSRPRRCRWVHSVWWGGVQRRLLSQHCGQLRVLLQGWTHLWSGQTGVHRSVTQVLSGLFVLTGTNM